MNEEKFEIEDGFVLQQERIVENPDYYGPTSEQKRMYLKQRQSLSISIKWQLSKRRIIECYEKYNGKVYISYSGGKDSNLVKDMVRSIYPEVPCVFSDTGLEYPELREFVKNVKNVVWLKPKKNFTQVIEEYGYPVVSKEQSQFLYEHRTTNSDKLRAYREEGNASGGGKISKKWLHLLDAPFTCSHLCCHYLKKKPFTDYEKKTGRIGFVGVMADESRLREQSFLKFGCNSFNSTRATSRPIMFWTEQDVFECMHKDWIQYPSVYGQVLHNNGKYETTGESRTGCMFCMFGVHLEQQPNKFQRMKITHPKIWNYCIYKLNLKQVLDYIGVPYE